MSEYRQDARNARRHDTRNREAIRRSLEELGAGRSVVVDAEGVAIAGNGVLAEARALGLEMREIVSDGRELIVIRRTDLAPDDPRRTALAIADNRAGELSDFDPAMLAELLTELSAEMRTASGFDPCAFAAEIAAQGEGAASPDAVDPEVPFATELMESQNYVILRFRNDIDWLAAQEHFQLRPEYPRTQRGERANRGIGRVVDGAEYLRRVQAK